MSLEVNAQAVIDQLLAQNRQLVAELAVLRAYLNPPEDNPRDDEK